MTASPTTYCDLHSHVLPGLDDGSKSPAQSHALIRLLRSAGFSTVCATPHQKASQYMPTREAIDAAWRSTAAMAQAEHGVELLLGAENYWDEVFLERSHRSEIPCYSGGRAFLLEIPPPLGPPKFEQRLFGYRAQRMLPVLAHPERYQIIQCDLQRAESVGKVCALVVDLGALDGAHGRQESKTARALLLEGLAHACASDVHCEEDVRAVVAGMAWIEKKLGKNKLEQLMAEGPRTILSGELPT